MTAAASSITLRHARREDVVSIVKMLADDALGGSRERIEDPLPSCYFAAFDKVAHDPNITLVVAEGKGGAVIGCLQLCILPGLSSQGVPRGLIEDVRVASHLRGQGIGERQRFDSPGRVNRTRSDARQAPPGRAGDERSDRGRCEVAGHRMVDRRAAPRMGRRRGGRLTGMADR